MRSRQISASLKAAALSFLFLLLTPSAFAQRSGDFLLSFGFQYGYERVLDEALSPISYSGSLGGLQLGFDFKNSQWLSQLEISGLGGFQYPAIKNEAVNRQTITGLVRAHYSLSRQVTEWKKWKIFVGLLSHNLYDYRNHNRYGNSQDNYLGLFSVGPVFSAQRPFTLWQKNFAFHYQLGLPVGTYYLRPSYIKPYTNGKIGNKGFAWWDSFYLLHSHSKLVWTLKSGNEIRLNYQWDFAQLNELNRVQIGGHQLALSTALKF